ncbi:MAG: agmatinase [Tenuifilum sp.]|uniref:agmatinase n=1 Tax=Tenuifilum sp. TaxID=2760880 RepID=UPI000ADC7CE2|nr:agmatinase [Bacteroidales bacterium]HOK62156.1 agmatinase [Tenuifilum sp.]MBP9029416.1 agmatinase [Bacteroidales bacterium]HOK86955.1 agmatinase [Tenuifilum sp.]HON70338.1 agmatinase [Tenuifilum sp.]
MIHYGDLPKPYCEFETSKVAIVPVPYDGTSTWIKGADKGPKALLDASANMEIYDIETDTEVYKIGIYTDKPITEDSSPEAMVEAVKERTLSLIDKGKFTVIIGGEHSVSIGTIQAHAQKYKNLSVLQIDAHTDLRDSYEGSKNNHACVMARAKELCPIVQVGIRSMDSGEKANLDPNRVFWAHKIVNCDDWMDKAIDLLTDNVYLTIDLDGFDPSILPSTGTPEPGGLLWYPTLKFLRKVIEKRNLVGFDIVELCPNTDDKASDFLAAKLLYKILTYKFLNQLK